VAYDGRRVSRRRFLAGGIGLAGASLIEAAGTTTAGAAKVKGAGSDLGAVEHVVFLMQENRSFDHYFGTYRGVNGFDARSDDFEQAWPVGRNGATTLLPFNLATTTAQLCSGNDAIPTHDWAPQHESMGDGTNANFVSVHSESANDGIVNGPIVMGSIHAQAARLLLCVGRRVHDLRQLPLLGAWPDPSQQAVFHVRDA
jgi:phospholipase C